MLASRCPIIALALLAACADGGVEDTPQSEVLIAANHHLMWFRTLPGFGTFPVDPNAVFAGNAVLTLADDSTYTLTTQSGTSSPDSYALAATGGLSLFFAGSGRDPGVVLRGGYRLPESESDLFFTDRVSNTTSASVGLYYGTRITPGQVEFGGDWHLLSLHAIFRNGLATPRNVGRAAHGAISITAGDPGTERTISGTGLESGSDASQIALTFSGTIQNVLDGNNVGDGTTNLTVGYTSGGNSDDRVFHAAAGRDIVMAVDSDESDGDSGALFLVRKFDAPATVADITEVAGEFLIGGHTLFVNPFNSGADTFVGALTLSPQGAFLLTAEDHRGADFSYTGTFTLADDGGMTFSVNGTNEQWFGVVTPAYDTIILVDDIVETRANATPELNLAIGVRAQAG